ncbi:MAG: hypothetical protein ABI212_10775 [Burkholderiaceae bacterium]
MDSEQPDGRPPRLTRIAAFAAGKLLQRRLLEFRVSFRVRKRDVPRTESVRCGHDAFGFKPCHQALRRAEAQFQMLLQQRDRCGLVLDDEAAGHCDGFR